MNSDELKALREDIDDIDQDIVELLVERFEIAEQIAQHKRLNGLPIENTEREQLILSSIASQNECFSSELTTVFSSILKSSKRIQRRCMNLYLIGMSGCGKSRCGKILSAALNLPFVDTDRLIVSEQHRSIDTIFDTDGETAFRKMEAKALSRLAAKGGMVVATGGGILTTPSNIPLIKSSGYVVFLDRALEKLLQQKTRNRPLLREGIEAIIRLYTERLPVYRSTADFIIDPDSKGAINRICGSYRRYIK